MWWIYALLSAVFAALTAVLARLGVQQVDSTLATAVRTTVVLILAWSIVVLRGGLGQVTSLSRQTLGFLMLSGVATGLSWLFYFRAL